MRTILSKIFLFAGLLSSLVFAQQPTQSITATQFVLPVNSVLSPVVGSVTQIGGSPGNAHYYYWIVPHYVVGAGAPNFVADVKQEKASTEAHIKADELSKRVKAGEKFDVAAKALGLPCPQCKKARRALL